MVEPWLKWRWWNGAKVKVQLQVERFLGVGVFWTRTELCVHVIVALVPCLPIHVTITTDKLIGVWRGRRAH